jgi:hypothetical protein
MKVNGLSSVRQAMQLTGETCARRWWRTTDSAELLLNEMEFLTDRIDHDLKQLREMGHPTRPGTRRASRIRTGSFISRAAICRRA